MKFDKTMTVGDMKKVIENLPDETEFGMSGFDGGKILDVKAVWLDVVDNGPDSMLILYWKN